MHLEEQCRGTACQTRKHNRAAREDVKPSEHLIDQALEEGMDDPQSRVAPGREIRVLMVVAEERQSDSNRVEDRWLLMKVVVVVGDAADLDGDLGLHLIANLLLVGTDVVLGDSRETGCVHPSL